MLFMVLLCYGLWRLARALWRMPPAFFHVLLAWGFMGVGVLHGLGMIYDPRRAFSHGAMVAICYAWAVGECLVVARLPSEPNLPEARVIP